MKHSRLLAGLGVSALLLGIAPIGSSSASPLGGNGVHAATAGAARRVRRADLAWLPARTDPNALVRVIVEVAGDSVAGAKGSALETGTGFSDVDAARVKGAAQTAQNTVAGVVQAHGGRVEQRYVSTINAIAVTMPVGQVTAIADRADVVNISPVRTYERDNGTSNAYTGATTAWTSYGATGAGVKIAILDTGVDYTHADFGGSGDPADFTSNDSTTLADGGFPTAKVVGGYDFVGDAYDAGSSDPANWVPHPDDDPLDCGIHGTHVAGTAAGEGVLADGSTYHGPYSSSLDPADFLVSPGSAPEASILAYRIFGCDGSVDDTVVIAAIDRAVADGADVINMSLGSSFGNATDAEAVAADNAAKAGVVVVVSAGNAGPSAYLVGGPSTAHRVISVAALDAVPSFPAATIAAGATTITAIDANAADLTGLSGTVQVVRDVTGGVSLGCDLADYPPPVAASTIFVVQRGICGRVDRALLAQQAGASAVIMINNVDGVPPFDDSFPGLDIPFLGVTAADANALTSLDGATVSITATDPIANPFFTQTADFSSGGPRSGDSGQKPDVVAPGVSVASASIGSGTLSESMSGTSMAAPHTAGIAALVRQVHPEWTSAMVKDAIVNTANPAAVGGFDTRMDGNGLVNPVGAIATKAVISAPLGETSVNFGFEELTGSFTEVKELTVRSVTSSSTQTYRFSTVWNSDPMGAVVTVSPSSITLPPGGVKTVKVKITISKARAAMFPSADQGAGVVTLRGQIVATPTNGLPTLRVPFLMAPHARSNVVVTKKQLTTKRGVTTGSISLKNTGFHTGDADVYTWLLNDGKGDASGSVDSRAVGVQYFPVDTDGDDVADDVLMVFAFADFDRFSSAAEQYEDTFLDVDGDGVLDHEVLVADDGQVNTGHANGVLATFSFDLVTGTGFEYDAIGAADGSVTLGFTLATAMLGITPASPPAALISTTGPLVSSGFDDVDGYATVDPFDPPTTSGDFIPLAPNGSAPLPVTARATRADEVPALGWMIVTLDDASGRAQAELVSR